jgi:hypothetical protein
MSTHKFKVGQVVVDVYRNTGYSYLIIQELDFGYEVKNTKFDRPFEITSPEYIESFETKCVPLELFNSPLFEALK